MIREHPGSDAFPVAGFSGFLVNDSPRHDMDDHFVAQAGGFCPRSSNIYRLPLHYCFVTIPEDSGGKGVTMTPMKGHDDVPHSSVSMMYIDNKKDG